MLNKHLLNEPLISGSCQSLPVVLTFVFYTFSVCRFLSRSQSCFFGVCPCLQASVVCGGRGLAQACGRFVAGASPSRVALCLSRGPAPGLSLSPTISQVQPCGFSADTPVSFGVSRGTSRTSSPTDARDRAGRHLRRRRSAPPRARCFRHPRIPAPSREEPIRAHASWPRLGALLGAGPSLRPPALPASAGPPVSQSGWESV